MNLRKFMTALYGDKNENHNILIWIPTKHGGKSTWFRDIAEATKFVAKKKKTNVYFQVGLAGRPHGPTYRCSVIEAKQRPIVAMPALFCDIDIKDPVHKHENLPETIGQALSIVKGHGYDPSIITHSGHGLQCFWVFREMWNLKSPALRESCAKLLAHLKATLKANAASQGEKNGIKGGWHIDSVQDMARILRPPGSKNHKNPLKVKPVMVIEENSYRYDPETFGDMLIDLTFEQLEDLLPAKPNAAPKAQIIIKEPPRGPDGKPLPLPDLKNLTDDQVKNQKPINPKEDGSIVLDISAVPPFHKLQTLIALDPTFAQTWHGKNGSLHDQSQSSYDMSICHQLVKHDWNDQEIANALISNRRLHENDPYKALRKDYVVNTILKCRKSQEKKSGIQTSSVAGEAFGTQYENIFTDAEIKESIKANHGLEILTIEKYLSDVPSYAIFTTKGVVKLANTEELIRPGRLQARVYECIKHYMPYDKKKWPDTLKQFITLCQDVELAEDELVLERVKFSLVEYLDAASPNARKEDAVTDKRPFIEYNHWHITFERFYKWMRDYKGEEQKSTEVRKALLDLKCKNTRFNVMRIDGDPKSRTTLRVMRVPNKILSDALAAKGYEQTPENFDDSELLDGMTMH